MQAGDGWMSPVRIPAVPAPEWPSSTPNPEPAGVGYLLYGLLGNL